MCPTHLRPCVGIQPQVGDQSLFPLHVLNSIYTVWLFSLYMKGAHTGMFVCRRTFHHKGMMCYKQLEWRDLVTNFGGNVTHCHIAPPAGVLWSNCVGSVARPWRAFIYYFDGEHAVSREDRVHQTSRNASLYFPRLRAEVRANVKQLSLTKRKKVTSSVSLDAGRQGNV